MENLLLSALSLVLAYFLGAIPTGYWCGKMLKGIDIREHGSKNMGATNVLRVLGKGPGIAVLLIDIVKGIVPVAVIAGAMGVDEDRKSVV